jgi:hypothetical protein
MQTLVQILLLLDDLVDLWSDIGALLALLYIILCLEVDFIFIAILNIYIEFCLD